MRCHCLWRAHLALFIPINPARYEAAVLCLLRAQPRTSPLSVHDLVDHMEMVAVQMQEPDLLSEWKVLTLASQCDGLKWYSTKSQLVYLCQDYSIHSYCHPASFLPYGVHEHVGSTCVGIGPESSVDMACINTGMDCNCSVSIHCSSPFNPAFHPVIDSWFYLKGEALQLTEKPTSHR